MLSNQEVEWLQVALREIDGLLRGLADFRPYNDLVVRDDARLQSLLEHVVTTVRDARVLSAKALSRLDDAHQTSLEEARMASEAAGAPARTDNRPARADGASADANGANHDGESHRNARTGARRRPRSRVAA